MVRSGSLRPLELLILGIGDYSALNNLFAFGHSYKLINICMNTPLQGAGALFLCPTTERVMLALRAKHKSHSMCWSLWGGKFEEGETPKEALDREIMEEMGVVPKINKYYPFDIFESKDKHFKFYTFVCIVDEEFIPTLNDENAGYCWVNIGTWPKPMHSGARKSFCNSTAQEKLTIITEQHKNV